MRTLFGLDVSAHRIRRVFRKMRENGPLWVPWAVMYKLGIVKLITPIMDSIDAQVSALRAGWYAVRRRWRARVASDRDTLYAFYDLNVNPITYDAAWFCVAAEVERRRRGLSKLQFVIVPGKHTGVRREPEDYEVAVDRDSRMWRLYNVVVPTMLALEPTPSVLVCNDRRQVLSFGTGKEKVFPLGYNPVRPVPFHTEEYARITARLSEQGMGNFYVGRNTGHEYIRRWRARVGAKDRMVVVTLRHYAYMPNRNSNLDAWVAFARGLDKTKYTVVFVPDTDTAFDRYIDDLESEFLVIREAAFNVYLRTALYESAFLNMSTMSGPASMFMLNKTCRYILFKMVVADAPMSTEAYLRGYGFVPGETPRYATERQKWVWEPDDLDVIEREFGLFEAKEAEIRAREEAEVGPDGPAAVTGS